MADSKIDLEWLKAQADGADRLVTETQMPETATAYKFAFFTLLEKVREYVEHEEKKMGRK